MVAFGTFAVLEYVGSTGVFGDLWENRACGFVGDTVGFGWGVKSDAGRACSSYRNLWKGGGVRGGRTEFSRA